MTTEIQILAPTDLWLRLSAFLSRKGGSADYLKVIDEWCSFLGVDPGSEKAARAFLTASDIHALAFCEHLRRRPGIPPRLVKSPGDERAIQHRKRALGKAKEPSTWTLSNSTQRKKITLIRSVYRYLVNVGVLRVNPFAFVTLPKDDTGSKRPTEMIDFSLVMKLIRAPDTSTQRGLRDAAILAVSFGGGLRRSETIKLRLMDFDVSPNGMHYVSLKRTKNGRNYDRHVIPDWAGARVKAYKDLRETQAAGPEDILFASTDSRTFGDPLNTSTIWHIFRRYAKKIGLGTWASPHSARATAITRLLDEGFDLISVRRFSRHRSFSTLEIYDKRRREMEDSIGRELKFDDEEDEQSETP